MAEAKRGVAELVVQGPAGQTFRQQLVEGQVIRLGRAPASGWAVSWDRSISREHADLCWKNGKLTITCLSTAANPVRLRGAPMREIVVSASEAFEIGQSSFYVDVTYISVAVAQPTVESEAPPAIRMPQPTAKDGRSRRHAPAPQEVFETKDVPDVIEENFFKTADLSSVAFGDPERQLEVLSKLPRLITGAQSDVELAYLLCGIILEAIPPATAVAVALFEESDVQQMKLAHANPEDTIPNPKLMRVQTRDDYDGRFVPSRSEERRVGKEC